MVTVPSTPNIKLIYPRMSFSPWKKSLNTLARRLIWFRTKSTRSRLAASILLKKLNPILPIIHSDRTLTTQIKDNNSQVISELSNVSKIARQRKKMHKEATTKRYKSTNIKSSSLKSKLNNKKKDKTTPLKCIKTSNRPWRHISGCCKMTTSDWLKALKLKRIKSKELLVLKSK